MREIKCQKMWKILQMIFSTTFYYNSVALMSMRFYSVIGYILIFSDNTNTFYIKKPYFFSFMNSLPDIVGQTNAWTPSPRAWAVAPWGHPWFNNSLTSCLRKYFFALKQLYNFISCIKEGTEPYAYIRFWWGQGHVDILTTGLSWGNAIITRTARRGHISVAPC